jgi:hypothetical protein
VNGYIDNDVSNFVNFLSILDGHVEHWVPNT